MHLVFITRAQELTYCTSASYSVMAVILYFSCFCLSFVLFADTGSCTVNLPTDEPSLIKQP